MIAGDPDPAEDLRLLLIHIKTMFAMSRAGRMMRESAPDNSSAPRLFFAGCSGGNVVRVRDDVSDRTARSALELARAEPPWSDPETPPRCLTDLVRLLARDAPAEPADPALIYQLPNATIYDAGAHIVSGDTAEGRHLLTHFGEDGMPPYLVGAGFVGLDDFWEPWVAAMEGGGIAAMAFAARIGARSMEVGVHTFPGFRGRGLAAAVTARWSSLPRLADHTLFYSTSRTNRSSQRVALRLGLRRFGVSIRIA